MKRQLIWMTASLAALGAGAASAQVYSSTPDYRYGDRDAYGQTVRCESTESRTRRCRIEDAQEVRLVRQLSRAACIEGRDWTYSRDEIRVTDGCRADFVVIPRHDDRYGHDDRQGYGRDQVIRCASRDRSRTYCGDGYGQYQMIGYRNANCVQGRTFGQDQRGLWVSDRCSAQFRRSHDNDRNRNGYGHGYGNQDDYAQTVHCAANANYNGRVYCGDADARYTLRDTNNRYCVEGRTYGTDSRGLWITNPCNAEFTRYPRYENNDTFPNDRYGQQPIYQND